jgi:hypothetical protein
MSNLLELGYVSLRFAKPKTMGLYHPLDGDTNLKYKLLCFLTPKKKKFKEKMM